MSFPGERRHPSRMCFVFLVCLVARPAATGQTVDEPLVRTRIQGQSIFGLTGRWLSFEHSELHPVRAWAGIVTDRSGGPAVDLILRRHAAWLRTQLRPVQTGSAAMLPPDEWEARRRHGGVLRPQYFDGVLLEFPETEADERRYCWMIDYDMDGQLHDESLCLVRPLLTPDSPPTIPEDQPNRAVLRLEIELQSGSPWPRTRWSPAGELDSATAVNNGREHAAEDPPPSKLRLSKLIAAATDLPALVAELHEVDNIRTRKQQLELVVLAADRVIRFIDENHAQDQNRLQLADALYRKGRALGYMELPDVVAVTPVKDPAALNLRFENNFARLDSVVDTTAPEYILLRIRRERRRDHRGTALDLVDLYRRTHSNPVWYYKKRFDLLTELGAAGPAHQAAAEMWLKAEMPGRPAPVPFLDPD